MPYSQTNWKDRVVEKPLTFTMQNNADGTITLVPSEGTIIESGTPITAAALNNMEQGIANSLEKAGGTVTGITTFQQAIKADGGISSTNGQLVIRGNNQTDGVIAITNNIIQNLIGTGHLVLKAGEGAGHVILASPTSAVYIQANTSISCVKPGTTATYIPVYGSSFTNPSDKAIKKNIVPFDVKAEDLVNSSPIYQFQYNHELEGEMPHTGLILQEAPVEVVDPNGVGIDLYSMTSVLWKAVQELSAKVQLLESKQG